MKKRMKMVDVLASALLVGVISFAAFAGYGVTDPAPFTKTCHQAPVWAGGIPWFLLDWQCSFFQECGYAVVYNSQGEVIDVVPLCIGLA